MKNTNIGPATPNIISHPANDKPNRAAGIIKNTTNKYKMANHLCLAVILPNTFAIAMGTLLMLGNGYQIIIPMILKNK